VTEEGLIVVFPSTHHALKAEKAAREKGLDVKMIPVPREISSDCNMGMKVSTGDGEAVKAALEESQVRCRLVPWPQTNA
jgi:hypothetical protein